MYTARKLARFTVEDYLAYDDALIDGKAEYDGGFIWNMSGGSYAHGVIPSNLTVEIGIAIKNKGCNTFNSDTKIGIAETQSYLYPDLGVVCGEPRFSEVRDDILINPILLVEVLSESSAARDRGMKFDRYWMIPSLREYVLVEQDRPQVEVYFRNDLGRLEYDRYTDLTQVVTFRSLAIKVSMADIYNRVKFPKTEEEAELETPEGKKPL